ncbi:MAG: peptide chain release factor N(5)-glutamine methyltransferase [Candidatus Marinimicrobia bacterium]|nr:peptide chain release factor N(5)-glutamine methyltransferase [Candidatus Neomarinimicrobiota bacterium]
MTESVQKTWRIIDVLKWSKDYLKAKQVESPQIEVEWILREVLGFSRLEIYLHHEKPLSAAELTRIKSLLSKRAAGQPIQYVLCSAEFMGLKFKVTPDVLIPRPETELLVEKTIALCKNRPAPRILDIGTVSGCIAIALAHNLPDCRLTAVDISSSAVKLARENAARHNVTGQIDFRELDILQPFDSLPQPFDIIVSNPPYVAGQWFAELPNLVRENEPEIALNPGADELRFYRRIANLAPEIGTPGGHVILEIGGDYQQAPVVELFSGDAFASTAVVKDYSGQCRIVIAELAG